MKRRTLVALCLLAACSALSMGAAGGDDWPRVIAGLASSAGASLAVGYMGVRLGLARDDERIKGLASTQERHQGWLDDLQEDVAAQGRQIATIDGRCKALHGHAQTGGD